jgi:hydroxypyruvate reductase
MLINQPIPEIVNCSADLNRILISALESVDPKMCVEKVLKRKNDSLFINDQEIRLQHINRINVIGVGKAVLPMALAVSDVMGDLISEGILIAKHDDAGIQSHLNKRIRIIKGSHPIPSEESVEATSVLLEMLKKTTPDDLVIGLISGGGSALMTYPVKEIGLSGLQNATFLLLKCGATIEEMNTIRKHLDLVKGGGLLKHIYPAKSIHLILSDVLGDPLSMIASGPTAADPTTFENCLEIINKYGIDDLLDNRVMSYLKSGAAGLIEETIKDGNPIIVDHKNLIVGSLSIAAEAACNQAKEAGFDAKILTTSLRGEARVVGAKLARQLADLVKIKKIGEKPICLIAGGETTVTVKGNGTGGRNQELALSAAQVLRGINNSALISFATDGEDGPTDAAGGFVTGKTLEIGLRMNLVSQDYLDNNNAYEYLNKVGGLIKTGPTGTNVNDLVLMLAF